MARVLILGGTAEAAALARALERDRRFDVILSLAGRTLAPPPMPAPTRRGGFGGAEGLETYLADAAIAAVIDATHPFATRISHHAAAACARAAVPRLALVRAPWQPLQGDHWREVEDEAAAARMLPAGTRAFLALGRQRIAPFAARADVWFLVRVVDAPRQALLPLPHLVIAARGPFAIAAERALLESHRISHLVARNSGGEAGRAKLLAARELGLPVIMIERPAPPPEPTAGDVASALSWLTATLP